MSKLTRLPAWSALAQHYREFGELHMRELFAQDPQRFQRFSRGFQGILFDFSKNRITPDTVDLLLRLARESDLERKMQALFAGDLVNFTENRAALHMALRNVGTRPMTVANRDVMGQVNSVLARIAQFCAAVHERRWRGVTGKPLTTIVNIGIGGSELGPALVNEALAPYRLPGMSCRYLSSADSAHYQRLLRDLDPETTLFVVASKTFSTAETITNARSARDWMVTQLRHPETVARHFVAVSANVEAATAFGIAAENVFEFWDWVGGRYSLWSAIGLPVALTLGMERFNELRAGAHGMDEHFRATPLEDNLPVLFGLIGLWYHNFFGCETQVVLPYTDLLRRLPAFLMQLDMESNGKRVTADGTRVDYPTGPIVWGGPGANGQHAFYQLLHLGTHLVPADFIGVAQEPDTLPEHRALFMANFFAQPEALLRGRTEAEARTAAEHQGLTGAAAERLLPHLRFPGNKPSNTILCTRLDPQTLGALLAFYEHKVFVQSAIWDINAFDQWGVELGKRLTQDVLKDLVSETPVTGHDASTNGLIHFFKQHRGTS